MNETKGSMKKTLKRAFAAIAAAAALFALSLTIVFASARYVAEIGSESGNINFTTETPFEVASQKELFNAINSGYSYVQLSDKLNKAPIIMTGDSLNLKRNLVIDLNGQEIERNNRNSLLNVPAGVAFTVIDTAGGGGLYNPIGSVLTVNGGTLNVSGGAFESGPRPSEYYSELTGGGTKNEFAVRDVKVEKWKGSADVSSSGVPSAMPILAIRSLAHSRSGNVFFDEAFKSGETVLIDADTYCYAIISGETSDDFGTFDISDAEFVYSYYVNNDASLSYYGDSLSETDNEQEFKQVKIVGYTHNIAGSVKESNDELGYAAVVMKSGYLDVGYKTAQAGGGELTVKKSGSFYSYFGTEDSSCICMAEGVMNVDTTGDLKTVGPDDFTVGKRPRAGETRENSSKYFEGACIMSRGGSLQFNNVGSLQSYNGSAISVSGGVVKISGGNDRGEPLRITKTATLSHADSPFDVADTGGQYPEGRQYPDAALFLNGGRLEISNALITVEKDLKEGDYGNVGSDFHQGTFGILSRGRTENEQSMSEMEGNNVSVQMQGAHSYGIFGTRGKVKLTNGSIECTSDSYCYGVYAENRAVWSAKYINIELVDTSVTVGSSVQYNSAPSGTEWYTTDSAGNVTSKSAVYSAGALRAASVGVYLDSHVTPGGKITLDGARVSSQEVGVAVYGGDLTFKHTNEDTASYIKAYNASAIALRGVADADTTYGHIRFDDAASSYEIESYINRKGTGASSGSCSVSDAAASSAGQHAYKMFIPWQKEGNKITEYDNKNGINVVGGSLAAYGKLGIRFRGLYNDNNFSNSKTNYNDLIIKSFAVCCEQEKVDTGGGVTRVISANINIMKADITSTVGGGVKVDGGAITMGHEGMNDSDVVINASGHVHGTTAYNVSSTITSTDWRFYANYSGGHAVISRGGTVEIHGGTYAAAFCNGIAAANKGDSLSKVIVRGGKFTGNLTHVSTPTYNTPGGPMSHYGLKVMAKAEVEIYGGEFDGKNGGAFVRGINNSARAGVKIYAGTFGDPLANEVKSDGQDGFNVYDFSTVFFGAHTEEDLKKLEQSTGKNRKDLLRVSANLFPISVNPLENDEPRAEARVYVFYGTYKIRNTARTNLGIGAIASNINDAIFRIYGIGGNVYNDTTRKWNNRTRIRNNSPVEYSDSADSMDEEIKYYKSVADYNADNANVLTSINSTEKYYAGTSEEYGFITGDSRKCYRNNNGNYQFA